jgi:8-oxo-dGDP phosphatase
MRPPILTDVEEHWPVTGSSDLHRDDWVVALRADTIRAPNHESGETFRRLVLEHPGAAIVLALDQDDRVARLSQYRHPAAMRFVELPAGLCDEVGEEPLSVARRELREEAGLEAASWTHLTSAYSSPGISAEVMHVYLARDLTSVGRGDFAPQHEEAEMELFWAPFAELHDAVVEGRVTDSPLLVAVLLAAARGLAPTGSPGR